MAYLKRLLKEHSVTQADLARLLGRDRSAITHLMYGRRRLKADEALLIAKYLRVPVTEVLGLGRESGFSETGMVPFHHAPAVKTRRSRHVVRKNEQYFLDIREHFSDEAFAMDVRDGSLDLHGILPGDIIISEMNGQYRDGDIVVMQHYKDDGSETILRLYQPPMLVPRSMDRSYMGFHEKDESIRIVSPVARLIRLY